MPPIDFSNNFNARSSVDSASDFEAGVAGWSGRPHSSSWSAFVERAQALNDRGLEIVAWLALEDETCGVGRPSDSLDLPLERAAVPAHGEMHTDPQLTHEGRVRLAPGRDER